MQCTGNSGCFPPEKASSHSAALPKFLKRVSYVQCFCVSIPPAVRPILFTTDGYGIFDVCTKFNVGAYRTHEGGRGGQVRTSLHKS